MIPEPFLGSGQGAGDSMARWGFISDALIRAYNKQVRPSQLIAPISKETTTTNIQKFVDDSHGLIIHDPTETFNINNLVQHNMQKWESLLTAIGGKLEIGKCQIVKFQWEYAPDGTQDYLRAAPGRHTELTHSVTPISFDHYKIVVHRTAANAPIRPITHSNTLHSPFT
jgi:hypothetical protein